MMLIPEVEAHIKALAFTEANDIERLRVVFNKRFKRKNPKAYRDLVAANSTPFDKVSIRPEPSTEWSVF